MSTTVVVAREFRGSRLYLTSSKPREFTWSNNRALALPVSLDVALRIMQECEDFCAGTDAFAIDKNECVIAHVTNGSVKRLRPQGYRDASPVPRRCAHPAGCEMLAEPGDIYCKDCREHHDYANGTPALMRRQAE